MHVEIYSDGSGTTLNLPGGWAFVIVVDGVQVYEESGGLNKATNNEAELTAAVNGLKYAVANYSGDDVSFTLVSDSQLVLGYASGAYKVKAYNLVPLSIELKKNYGQLGATTRWVKGHSGDIHNERCDVLAGSEREKLIKAMKP